MKRTILALTLTLLLLLAAGARAEDSGYRFTADHLGFQVVIDQKWVEPIENGKISFWLRQDEQAAQGGILGYGVVYLTNDLSGFSGFTQYDAAEAWLNENCLPIAAVAAHREGASLQGLYPGYARVELGAQNQTYFTLLRPDAIDSQAAGDQAQLAQSVWEAMGEEGRFLLFDPEADYGALGVFEATALNGQTVTQDYFSQAPMTVVNFWATYCGPCVQEMPILASLSGEYAGSVQFLGVVTDAMDEETLSLAAEIAQKAGADFPSIPPIVSEEILSTIQYVPTTYFLDQSGQIVGEPAVGGMSEAGWRAAIEEHLALIG